MATAKKYNLVQTSYDTLGTETFYPYRVETVGAYYYYYNRAGVLVDKRGTWLMALPTMGEWVTEISQFNCQYSIKWEVAGTIKVPVLDVWPFKKKPVAVSTNGMISYDQAHTEAINKMPDERWYLLFSDTQLITIGEWNALSLQEQADYLGETPPEVKEEEENNEVELKTSTAAAATPAQKTNWLWLIPAGILTLTVGVSVWAYRRYRRVRKKAEVAALKYGKYSRDIVDAVT